jgi:hypothetical protein
MKRLKKVVQRAPHASHTHAAAPPAAASGQEGEAVAHQLQWDKEKTLVHLID